MYQIYSLQKIALQQQKKNNIKHIQIFQKKKQTYSMDIQQNQNNDNQQLPPSSPTKSNHHNHTYLRQSIKSRMSNQSMISIPQPKNYPQKISLESNISEKIRQKQSQRGLFQQLINNDNQMGMFQSGHFNYLSQLRLGGSNPTQYRLNRMSDENKHQYDNNAMVSEQNNLAMQQQQEPISIIKIICKCQKSKCLLMYCQCFSKGLICNEQCGCNQCRNNSQFEQKRVKARQSVLERDPNAFTNKLQIVGGEQTQLAHKRGCNCKKTRCFKKYCECFHAGVKCTYLCQCEGCLNGGQNAYKE